MSTLYVRVPGTQGMVTVCKVDRTTLARKRSRNVLDYAKRIAIMAAGIDGHGYAEVWDRYRRIYVTGHANR